ncbi:MAG: rod shape-determining protein RodA [Marinifilaceae bacterium]
MRNNVNILKNLDWMIIFLYLLLVFMGWINIYAAVYNEEYNSIFDTTQKYGKQLLWIGASSILAVTILIIDSKFFSIFANFIYVAMIILLISVLFFGREVNGARSWFELGSIRFQPAEFAKFATCLVLAKYMSKFNFKIMKLKSFITLAIITFTPAVLIILQNDTGSALVYSSFILVFYREGLPGIFIFLCFVCAALFILSLMTNPFISIIVIICGALLAYKLYSRNNKEPLVAGFTISILFAGFKTASLIFEYNIEDYKLLLLSFILTTPFFITYIYKRKIKYASLIIMLTFASIGFSSSVNYIFQNVLEKHQSQRIKIMLGIVSDPYGQGYNVNQSKIAIGSGGLSGKGFLQGTQTKYDFVPEQSTDFIFCTVGEEWGFIGTSFVISIFIILILRIIYLAERQRSVFSRVYGYGVACILFFHLAVNVGMTIGLAPVIGIPLPFFSYGGSSLWSFTILMFIFIKLDANRLELLG